MVGADCGWGLHIPHYTLESPRKGQFGCDPWGQIQQRWPIRCLETCPLVQWLHSVAGVGPAILYQLEQLENWKWEAGQLDQLVELVMSWSTS